MLSPSLSVPMDRSWRAVVRTQRSNSGTLPADVSCRPLVRAQALFPMWPLALTGGSWQARGDSGENPNGECDNCRCAFREALQKLRVVSSHSPMLRGTAVFDNNSL